MAYHLDDTIVAIASPPGGAARGIVRLSGPKVVQCITRLFRPDESSRVAPINFDKVTNPTAISGNLHLPEIHSPLPADLYLWPNGRSYTGQSVAELHTLGSPPLLDAVLQDACESGARLAEPGEFTLRAFLAGRIDLTQAEAVLGVIDATSQKQLDVALEQLAGGLSRPLVALRGMLVELLAHLEAAFDFPEEDVTFITPEQLTKQLTTARHDMAKLEQQLKSRRRASERPRLVLVGRPNAGKSSLFNALVRRDGAIVSHQPGTTRDYISAEIDFDGLKCELIDTAGVSHDETTDDDHIIQQVAEVAAQHAAEQADVRIHCVDAASHDIKSLSSEGGWGIAQRCPSSLPSGTPLHYVPTTTTESSLKQDPDRKGVGHGEEMTQDAEILVFTKIDLIDQADWWGSLRSTHPTCLLVSSTSGEGLDALRSRLHDAARQCMAEPDQAVASTASRCSESLRAATAAIERAEQLIHTSGGDELIAAEIRIALDAIGRVAGTVHADDVLELVFSRFCIGK